MHESIKAAVQSQAALHDAVDIFSPYSVQQNCCVNIMSNTAKPM